jgi:hypothetical protein
VNATRRPRSKIRRLLVRLVAVLAAVVVALGIAEIALRVLDLHEPHPRTGVGEFQNVASPKYALDAELGWRMPRGARWTVKEAGRDILYASNQDGFRVDPQAPPPRDPRHLVAVGDSFTFGTGVAAADSYPSVLARLLGGWKLTNLAQPGYAVDQIWQSLVREGIPRAPDLVVAGIFPEDLERCLSAYRVGMNRPAFRLESGRLVRRTAADRSGPIVRFLEKQSRVFTLARQIEVSAGFRFGVGEMWNLNEAMFDEMRRSCREAGVPLVFVLIPHHTIESVEALTESMRKTGALFVDPVPAMKARPGPFYLDVNLHLNDAGHQLVAEEIAAFVRGRPEILGGKAESRAK